MSILRAVWWGLALAAVMFVVWTSISPISGVSLSCSKTGELGLDGDRASLGCDDSIVHVMGVWPLILLGVLLVVPPVAAAVVMRSWASWLVVATFFVLTFVASANWPSFWISLGFAAPMALAGLVIATVQQVVSTGTQAQHDSDRIVLAGR